MRVIARMKAFLLEHWQGRAGAIVRNTLEELGEAAEYQTQEGPSQIIRAVEGLASEKHAKALLDYAQRETVLIQAEIERRTADSKVRQEQATATKQEAEALLAQLNLLEAKVRFIRSLKEVGLITSLDS